MSTQGQAEVQVVGGSITVICGGAALVGAAVVGLAAGIPIIIYKGAVLVGKKLEENYEEVCKLWTAQYDAAEAEQRGNVSEIGRLTPTTEEINYGHSNTYAWWQTATSTPPTGINNQQAYDEASALTDTIDNNRKNLAQAQREADRQALIAQLQAEINEGRDILPAEQITNAEAALNGSPETLRQALNSLQLAWTNVTNVEDRQAYQRRQANRLLTIAASQLNEADIMLSTAGVQPQAAYISRKQTIESQISEARTYLETTPDKALSIAQSVQELSRILKDEASTILQAAWDKTRREVNSLRGSLTALAKMTEEARVLTLIDQQKAEALTSRISAAQSEAEALAQTTTPNIQQRISRLQTRTELLKDEVFELVQTKQQHNIAQTVASTLAEFGFQSHAGNQPIVRENGDVIRVEAMRAGNTPNFGRDDKVVSFDISRNGEVSYDFSGYVGDSCVHDAETIFAAFRTKGILIVDAHAIDNLPKDVTIETLSQPRYQPHFTANKVQAALAERLASILRQMGYPAIRQNSVGGSIEIEAFYGSTGYHVVLSPEGPVQVFKDASHTDISADSNDLIVAEVQHELEDESLAETIDEQQKTGYVNFRKQQLLEH